MSRANLSFSYTTLDTKSVKCYIRASCFLALSPAAYQVYLSPSNHLDLLPFYNHQQHKTSSSISLPPVQLTAYIYPSPPTWTFFSSTTINNTDRRVLYSTSGILDTYLLYIIHTTRPPATFSDFQFLELRSFVTTSLRHHQNVGHSQREKHL